MKTVKQTFAASRAHVWLKCAASEESLSLGKNKFSTRDAFADEGVLIHARAARLLGADIAETSAEYQLFANADSDAQSVVDFYIGAVQRTADNHNQKSELKKQLFVEYDMQIENDSFVFRVIPDAIVLDKETNTLTIFDLKTGFTSVSAEDNEQLLIGAHAFAEKHNLRPAQIVCVIVQPRLSTLEYSTATFDEQFFTRLSKNMRSRLGKFTPGAHCKGCGVLTTCKMFRDTLDAYLDPSTKDGLMSRPDAWARSLAISGPAKKFFETLESEAKDFLELGGTIPGFALTKTGGKRQWFRELSAETIAETLAIKTNDLYEPAKMATVAQIEKKIDKDKRDALRSIVYQPQNKTLAVVDNKSFLAREGEKIIQIHSELKINKKEKKENGKDKRKDKDKRKNA